MKNSGILNIFSFFLFLVFLLHSDFAYSKQGDTVKHRILTSGYVYMNGTFDATAIKFKNEFEGALHYIDKIKWKPYVPSTKDTDMDSINQAFALIKEGKQDGADGNIEDGFEKFQKALKLFDANIFTLSTMVEKAKKKYRSLLKKIAIFAYYLNDKKTAKTFIFRYFSMRPKAKFKKWPKEMKRLFHRVQKGFLEKGRGKLSVTTDPPDSKVYYKLKFKGVAPVSFNRVPPGEVILCVTHEGFEPKIERFQFDPANPQIKNISLDPLTNSILANYILPAKSELGVNQMGSNLRNVAKEFGVDLLVMTYIDISSSSDAKVTMFLFDRRLKKKLKEITKSFNPNNYEHKEISNFVNQLFKNVDLSGVVISKKIIKKPGSVLTWSKIIHNKYFLPIVGGVSGSILIGAIITGLYLYSEDNKSSKPPIGGKIITGF